MAAKSGFVYVESDPPLAGAERKRDYSRQYQRWRRLTIPGLIEHERERGRVRYATNDAYRAAQRTTAQKQRARGYFREYYLRKKAERAAASVTP